MLFLVTLPVILFCVVSIFWLAYSKSSGRLAWLLRTLMLVALFMLIYQLMPVAFLGCITRRVLVVALIIAAAVGYRRLWLVDFSRRVLIVNTLCALVITVLLVLSLMTGVRHIKPEHTLELAFPLKGGTFRVLQGGSSPLTNYFHRRQSEQRYALDLIRSTNCRLHYKVTPEQDESFGEPVYSPLDGQVVAVLENLPDSRGDSLGNYLVIAQGPDLVTLAGLMQESIMVEVGQRVKAGEPLARIGFSGSSIKPKLHLHVTRGGHAAAALFEGRMLALNDKVKN